MAKMEDMVLGFAFTTDHRAVLLQKKSHPAWQANRYNGIGGHIEAGEDPHTAIEREAHEEIGWHGMSWDCYAIMSGRAPVGKYDGRDWRVFVFRSFVLNPWENDFRVIPDEPVELLWVTDIHKKPIIKNLAWLIPLALDLQLYQQTIEYREYDVEKS